MSEQSLLKKGLLVGRQLALGGVVVLGASAPALAFSVKDIESLFEMAKSTGEAEVSYTTLEQTGDDILIEGLSIVNPNGSESVTIAKMRFDDITVRDNGTANVAIFDLDDLSVNDRNTRVTLEDIRLENLSLPDFEKVAALSGDEQEAASLQALQDVLRLITHASMKNFKVSSEGVEVTVDAIEANQSDYDETSKYYQKGDFKLTSLKLPGTLPRSDEYNQGMAALGYNEVDLSITSDAQMDIAAGDLKSTVTFDAKNMGAFTFDANLGGITAEFLETASKINPDSPDAAIGALSGLTLKAFKFKFDNASIFEKGIALAGQMQGLDADVMMQQAQSFAILGTTTLAQFDKNLAQQATSAIQAFFAEPKSISVTVAPDPELSLLEGFAAAEGDPSAIIKRLNANVTANE